eukprot:g6979.t2
MDAVTAVNSVVNTTESITDKNPVLIERFDAASESPNNNNNTSTSSSPKNTLVASSLLKMLDDESILAGLEDIPPSLSPKPSSNDPRLLIGENLLDDPEIFKKSESTGVREMTSSMEYQSEFVKESHGSSHPSDIGSFVHSYSDISENDDESTPLQFNTARQFELEFKLHEAEQKIEQLSLQLKGKSMQLEQVQVALMSYEEEIMNLRSHSSPDSDDQEDHPVPSRVSSNGLSQTPTGAVSLETAEQLSTKIIKLQQRVEELEDGMVNTKMDNAQLKETNDFLKSKLKKITKKPVEKKQSSNASSVRNIFNRN